MTGTADLNYSIAIVNPDGTPLAGFITQWNSLRTDVGKALDAAATAVAGSYQPLDPDLTTIAGQTNTPFGLSLLTEASAAHLLGTTLNAYTKTQTDSAITTALGPYLTSATAASTYQLLGSYVRYDAQTLTSPQQAQARTNIGAQVAGSYPTGSGTCSGTNTGDQTITLTGDVTGSGTGSFAAIIGANKVTLAQMATVATATLLGRTTAGTGNVEAMTVTQAKALLNLTGTNSGDQTITLTGDVTGSGTGSFAATLVTAQPSAHTWATTQTFTLAPVFTDQPGSRTALGLGTLATQSGTFSGTHSGTSSGTNTGDQTITLTGDVTGSGTGSFAATIGANKVTLAQMATVATATFLGRTTAATGNVEALTVAQAKALLNLTGTNSGDQTITLTGDVTGAGTGSFAATLATAQPAVHTWALAQTFTVAPVFTDQSGSRAALGLATVANSGSATDLTTGTLPVAQTAALTGAITKPAGSNVTTYTTVPVASGGTGAITAPLARVALNVEGRTAVGDAAYTILATDKVVAATVTLTAGRTWTLPAANSVNAGQFILIDVETAVLNFGLTIAAAGTDLLNSTTSVAINTSRVLALFVSNGSNQWVYDPHAVRGATLNTTPPASGSSTQNIGTGTRILAAALTANSNLTLSTNAASTGLSPGDIIEYRRPAADAFTASIKNGAGTVLVGAVVNRTYRFLFNGSDWIYWGSTAD